MSLSYDRLADDYARHRRVHPGVLRGLISGGQPSPGSRVLEVGCGTANYTAALMSASGCSCWGIDPSEAMLDKARVNAPGAALFQMRGEDLGFDPDSFDLVFSVDVIHHIADHLAHYRSAHSVLSPGGRICTVTDSEWIIRNRRPLASHFPETVDVELARYPPIPHLKKLMDEAGFTGITDEMVEHLYEVRDIAPHRDRAFSSLHLISEQALEDGLKRLEQDLQGGPLRCVSRYLLVWGTR